jgi:hypothetical protein
MPARTKKKCLVVCSRSSLNRKEVITTMKKYCSNCHCAIDDVNPEYSNIDFDAIRKAVDHIELEFKRGTVKVDDPMCFLDHLHNYLCEQLFPDYQ